MQFIFYLYYVYFNYYRYYHVNVALKSTLNNPENSSGRRMIILWHYKSSLIYHQIIKREQVILVGISNRHSGHFIQKQKQHNTTKKNKNTSFLAHIVFPMTHMHEQNNTCFIFSYYIKNSLPKVSFNLPHNLLKSVKTFRQKIITEFFTVADD